MANPYPKFINWYTYTGQYLNVRWALLLFLSEIIVGIIGFTILENYSFNEALYMTVITLSTVGYGEVETLSTAGRTFTTILILVNIGIFAYGIAAFTSFVVQGEFFKAIHFNVIQKSINQLNDHIILCGYGKYGKEVTQNFLKHKLDFVVIEQSHEEIEKIQKSNEAILYIEGDATEEDILEKAGIHKAKAIICALDEDANNIFTVITARQMSLNINIISRARLEKTGKKLLMAGADHIIRPEQIGGFYMASLVNKPGAVEFFAYLANEAESDIRFEELAYEKLPSTCHDISIRELKIREATGANVIGYKKPDGTYTVNPVPDCKMLPNSSFIVLGSQQQLDELRKYLDQFK